MTPDELYHHFKNKTIEEFVGFYLKTFMNSNCLSPKLFDKVYPDFGVAVRARFKGNNDLEGFLK